MAALALLLTYLPTIISVAQDVTTVVNAAKAAGSVYQAVKTSYPDVADIIDKIGAALPPVPGASAIGHLDDITSALFGDTAWIDALRRNDPSLTGGGSAGYNALLGGD